MKLAAVVLIALGLAGARLLADALIPPHLVWWLTPFVAFHASIITSWLLFRFVGKRTS